MSQVIVLSAGMCLRHIPFYVQRIRQAADESDRIEKDGRMKDYKMTGQQAEERMLQYENVFSVVRLLDAAQVGGEESVNSFCSCYSYWGKNTPCRNCISRQVLEDHRQRT